MNFRNRAPLPPLDYPLDLSIREREIVQLAYEGLTTSEIAGRLTISPGTVATHLKSARRKAGISQSKEIG